MTCFADRDQLISVIIPAYNAANTINKCLTSVLSQSYSDVEIIIVDDGSSDETLAVCRPLAEQAGQVKIFSTENKGVSAARNLGMSRATGKWFFFLDADDHLLPDALRRLFDGYKRSGAPLVIGGFDRVTEKALRSPDGLVFGSDRLLAMPAIVTYLYRYLDRPNKNPLFVFSWGRLIQADIVRRNKLEFEPTMRTMEDVHFNFRLLRCIDRLYYVSDRLYFYQLHARTGSQSVSALGHPDGLAGFVPALECARTLLEEQSGDPAWVARWLAQAHASYCIVSLIRLSLLVRVETFGTIAASFTRLIDLPQVKEAFQTYRPAPGDSNLLPYLVRRRYVYAAMLVARYKAWQRYGRR